MSSIIATFFGIGHLRPAPGTWGSLAALLFVWPIHSFGGWGLLVLATAVAFTAGWWATVRETAGKDDHDPSEIVIDEVVGQWIALLPVSVGATMMGASFWALWPGVLSAFILFRLFDITKPGPVGWADKRNDAYGVMMDDVIAGIFAAVCVVILAAVAHLVLM
jgi:phosphatidylglycerophosphatase A